MSGGGFRHGDKDRGGPFLGDSLAMGQAFLDLYAATGNRDWLSQAAQTRRRSGPGRPLYEFAEPLFRQGRLQGLCVGCDALPDEPLERGDAADAWRAARREELADEPTHITIVGYKDDSRAQSLHAT